MTRNTVFGFFYAYMEQRKTHSTTTVNNMLKNNIHSEPERL